MASTQRWKNVLLHSCPLCASLCCPLADKWCLVCSKHHDRRLYRFMSACQTVEWRKGSRNNGAGRRNMKWERKEMEEGLKVRAGNEASRENTFIFWHMNNLFATPPSSMHNVFLHHWQRYPWKALWEWDTMRVKEKKGEGKCLADIDGDVSRR